MSREVTELPSPIFQTARLAVRHLGAQDLSALEQIYGDREAMRWVDDGSPLSREGCARWIDVTLKNYAVRGYGMSAVTLPSTGQVIGFCGLVHPNGQVEAELKYALRRSAWGKGYASEAAIGMIQYGFAVLGLKSIIATIAPENLASKAILIKCGMQELESRLNSDKSETLVFRIESAQPRT